ncbi:hypothetical protein R3W88_032966 [Solanum pinnatisectum]|uniref:Gag-pol polyprotein n=1 Tax=Solanum pinnatisectum TaxID=50273 RepID=A0AAV9K2B5_9SOLN|nr:hypothetical protein R3W88_032966 [Solanum pinnatisectum]
MSINLPFVEGLLEMPGYSKFMKELVTKKRSIDFKTVEVSHSCSAIMTSNIVVVKKADSGAFTIPCTIGIFQFAKSLCDLGANINLILFIFLADFVILECAIDAKVPIILGRPFLATERALMDVESGELKFQVNDEEVTFNVCKSMKQPRDIHVVSVIM